MGRGICDGHKWLIATMASWPVFLRAGMRRSEVYLETFDGSSDICSTTLAQLIQGVRDAQTSIKGHGGRIVPYGVGQSSATGATVQNIEFDVAVTVTEGSEKKGGLGVSIASLSLGGTAQASSTNSSISRIKFSIPVAWPLEK